MSSVEKSQWWCRWHNGFCPAEDMMPKGNGDYWKQCRECWKIEQKRRGEMRDYREWNELNRSAQQRANTSGMQVVLTRLDEHGSSSHTFYPKST